jgi:hypothetical protein
MPQTATGWPYPSETDTPDVPRDIKALADALEARVARAVLTGNTPVPVTSAASATAAVTFPAGKFTATPVIVVSTSGTSFWCAFTSTASVNGFTATVRHIDATVTPSATPTVAWNATLV